MIKLRRKPTVWVLVLLLLAIYCFVSFQWRMRDAVIEIAGLKNDKGCGMIGGIHLEFTPLLPIPFFDTTIYPYGFLSLPVPGLRVKELTFNPEEIEMPSPVSGLQRFKIQTMLRGFGHYQLNYLTILDGIDRSMTIEPLARNNRDRDIINFPCEKQSFQVKILKGKIRFSDDVTY